MVDKRIALCKGIFFPEKQSERVGLREPLLMYRWSNLQEQGKGLKQWIKESYNENISLYSYKVNMCVNMLAQSSSTGVHLARSLCGVARVIRIGP